MTTTKDIARELGISHSTVSRVLSGNSRVPVALETRERVMEAAQRMNYRPNVLARSLQQGRTGIVGFYSGYGVLDLRLGFFSEILLGCQTAGADFGLDLLLHCFHHHSKLSAAQVRASQEEQLERLHNGRVDGFLVCAQPDDFLVERLQNSALPIVAVAELFPQIPSVVADDEGGMALLAEHLCAQGHRKFLFLAPEGRFSSARRRFSALEKSLLERGQKAPSVWSLKVGTEAQAVARFLALPPNERPDAICCWNDTLAYNFLHQANAAGLRAPDDFALSGFDGFPDKWPGGAQQVCTVSCDWHGAGQSAMRLLHSAIEGQKLALQTTLSVTLLAGDTA